jgi:hypothetical protein
MTGPFVEAARTLRSLFSNCLFGFRGHPFDMWGALFFLRHDISFVKISQRTIFHGTPKMRYFFRMTQKPRYF